MTDLSRDPIVNTIHNGIKRGIRVAIENECYGSAVVLILSGIDTMAYLGMPDNQQDVTHDDFVRWVDRYIKFSCKHQLTGLDLYGARCGMLHSFSTVSNLSRQGKCRQVGYMDRSVPEIRFDPNVSEELVLVSIEGLAKAFLQGVDKFMIDLYADKRKAKVADERFQHVVHTFPCEKDKTE
jgi:hypothetical protein